MQDATDLLAFQMRSLAAVVPGVAHDLRGPINTMVFTLELLRESAGRVSDPALRARQLGYVEVLAAEAARLHRGLETFFAHAAAVPGKRQALSLAELVSELADLAAGPLRQRRIGLARRIAGERLAVEADGPALRHALLLVLLAALDAAAQPAGLTLAAFASGGLAVVEVAPAGSETGGRLDAARALLRPFGGTLVAVTDEPAGTPSAQRVELPLFQGGSA